MPDRINLLAESAVKDMHARENLIIMQEQTILKIASVASHRYINKSDDEWSVALLAFSRAVDTYSAERGDFMPYAGLLIRRDLTDYYRANARDAEMIISLNDLSGNPNDEEKEIDFPDPNSDVSHNTLKDEIAAANEMLMEFGFRFFDLTECSPRQEKTREQCAAAIRVAIDTPIILSELRTTHKLPVKAISRQSGVSRKILDRYRKYIIMAILILSGDFPQIAEYLKFVRREETT